MLSPGSFRICAIAAMAPALTEAASQAESFSLPHSPASSSVCNPASPPVLTNGSALLPRKFRDHRLLWDSVSLAALANVKLLRLREQTPAQRGAHAGAMSGRVAGMGLTNGSAQLHPADKPRPNPAPDHELKPRLKPNVPPPRVPLHEPVDETPVHDATAPDLLERVRTRRNLLERRSERLHRRIRKLQLRQAVQHAAGQMAAFFDHQQTTLGLSCLMPQRLLHRKLRDSSDLKAELLLQSEDVKSLSTAALVSLVRKLEESSSQGAAVAAVAGRNPVDVKLKEEDRLEGERAAGTLRSTLTHQEHAVDSDATETSSGGESGDDEPCDRLLPASSAAATVPSSAGGVPTTTQLPSTQPERKPSIRQSWAWRWAMERAAVASRWTWLQAQVADLEFRIRQQSDLCRQLRRAKGPLKLDGEDPVLSCEDSPSTAVPEDAALDDKTEGTMCKSPTMTTPAKPNGLVLPQEDGTGGGCVRTRPLSAGFRKRKVVLAASALASARKSARLSATVQCPCRSVCGPSSPGGAVGWGCTLPQARVPVSAGSPTSPSPPLLPPPPPPPPPGSPATSPTTLPPISGVGVGAPEPTCPPLSPCLVCAGRYNSVRPLDADLMTRYEKAALLDPGFHPVLSFRTDIPLNLHFEMLLRTGELQKLALRASATLRKKSRLAQVTGFTVDQARKKSRKLAHNAAQTLLSTAKLRRHHGEKKRPYRRHMEGDVTIDESCSEGSFRRSDGSYSLMSMKQRERQRSLSTASSGSSKAASPVPSPAPSLGDSSSSQLPCGAQGRSILQEVLRRRRGENAFDINNIVIPYSIASATRVERLPYKEILTPKWRVLSEEELNGTHQEPSDVKDEVEDMTDEAFQARHNVCEEEERHRFAGLLSKAALNAQAHPQQPPPPTQQQQQLPQQPEQQAQQQHPFQAFHQPHVQQVQPGSARLIGSVVARQRTDSGSTLDPYELDAPSMSPPSPWSLVCEMDPYEPRSFPLDQAELDAMLAESPHLLPTPPGSPLHEAEPEPPPFDAESTVAPPLETGDADSPLSSASSALVPDDPNDPEWTVVASERKQNLVLKLTKR